VCVFVCLCVCVFVCVCYIVCVCVYVQETVCVCVCNLVCDEKKDGIFFSLLICVFVCCLLVCLFVVLDLRVHALFLLLFPEHFNARMHGSCTLLSVFLCVCLFSRRRERER
jgi:hypothetical protein